MSIEQYTAPEGATHYHLWPNGTLSFYREASPEWEYLARVGECVHRWVTVNHGRDTPFWPEILSSHTEALRALRPIEQLATSVEFINRNHPVPMEATHFHQDARGFVHYVHEGVFGRYVFLSTGHGHGTWVPYVGNATLRRILELQDVLPNAHRSGNHHRVY